MIFITITKKDYKSTEKSPEQYLEKLYEPHLRTLLRKCYQCARCSGVCQLSKVQKYTPSRIIQTILEGGEDKIIRSGILWDCLTCNSCLQNCPQEINFADIVCNAKYKTREYYKQNSEDRIAHKGFYTSISELISKPHVNPNKNLDWVPKEYNISDTGSVMYFVGCLPYFKFEFDDVDTIAPNALKVMCKIEREPVVVRRDEVCCGHDLYWGQGNFKAFIDLAIKNKAMFESAGVSTIVTTCSEGYRTFKVDYPKLFDDFNEKFEVKHFIEYVYEKWKEGRIEFVKPDTIDEKSTITFHDPCRLSRFLPKDNAVMEQVREILEHLTKFGLKFKEMEHNKANALCCGISSWMNCNERSKALRYKRMLEAKQVADTMVTCCPKCEIHFNCLQRDFEDISSVAITDFSEFIVDFIKPVKNIDSMEGYK